MTGPIPGICCNCSAVAEFKSSGCAGGTFFCASAWFAAHKKRDATASCSSNHATLRLEFN